MSGKFHLKKAANGQFHFNLEAGNGQPILTSELYKSKDSALNGIDSVRRNAVREGAFEPLLGKDGRPYFVLKAGNGQTIGQSQMYASVDGCKLGMESVRRHAPDAVLVDETQG